jgi:hypothetical protein
MALSFAGRVVIFIDFASRLYDARMDSFCFFRADAHPAYSLQFVHQRHITRASSALVSKYR